MNACSIDHYRITCTDPNNDTLVHENGSSTGSSTLCDKFEFETDPNSANGRYIKVNEANYPDVLADKLAHLGSYVIRMQPYLSAVDGSVGARGIGVDTTITIILSLDCNSATFTGPSSVLFEIEPPPSSNLSKAIDTGLDWSIDGTYFTSGDLWYWQGQTKDFELPIYKIPDEYDSFCNIINEFSEASDDIPDFMTYEVSSSTDLMNIKMVATINQVLTVSNPTFKIEVKLMNSDGDYETKNSITFKMFAFSDCSNYLAETILEDSLASQDMTFQIGSDSAEQLTFPYPTFTASFV